jgi:hypothetical protein
MWYFLWGTDWFYTLFEEIQFLDELIQNYENIHVRNIVQGEAQPGKYNRIKLGGGQAYECSSD